LALKRRRIVSLQDRNIHRDAIALRRALSIPLRVPAAGVDQDEPVYSTQPRFNYRISDLSAYADVVATAALAIKAQAVEDGAAVGSPQLGVQTAITMTVEEFWFNKAGVLTNVGAQSQGLAVEPFTVLDGFWGVFLVIVDDSDAIHVIVNGAIQAYATEEIALANAPAVRPSATSTGIVGRVAIGTINAVGGDFIAGTTNTDAALVAAFNTAPQDGHVATLAIAAVPQQPNSVLAQELRDASGTRILEGKGGVGGDLLVISARTDGVAVLTNGIAVCDIRPVPAGGEGRGDMSVSQTNPQFVP
jgi:hypothetical protein